MKEKLNRMRSYRWLAALIPIVLIACGDTGDKVSGHNQLRLQCTHVDPDFGILYAPNIAVFDCGQSRVLVEESRSPDGRLVDLIVVAETEDPDNLHIFASAGKEPVGSVIDIATPNELYPQGLVYESVVNACNRPFGMDYRIEINPRTGPRYVFGYECQPGFMQQDS